MLAQRLTALSPNSPPAMGTRAGVPAPPQESSLCPTGTAAERLPYRHQLGK